MRRRRWRSSPTGKSSRKKKLILAMIIFFLFFLQFFIFVERNLRPPLMSLAKVRIKQIATQTINSAIADTISKEANAEQLIDWKTDNNGKITGFMLNYAEHMRITAETINTVQKELDNLTSMPEHIPLGQALNSTILASFGPDVPIRLLPVGNVKVDLSTRHQNAGINMILVEVFVRIIAEVKVIIPLDSEAEIVETEIPISYSLVVGDVPTYYFDNKGNPVGTNKDSAPNMVLPNVSFPLTSGGSGGDLNSGNAGSGNGSSGNSN
ncbi:sporulation protein YunB [Paenibacillus eucommiae]|uniref:Sporulation protein YunB n=1 Tax=Paenibacillus eucommiae TaxID=1355755 RepID=A0ABS4IZR3_9BACL|nr:sporulation protein YunB [Paenibacillus eucommiae]MBP1993069.1 sporulation protein YunB [Paenibacillus eucommiae]